MDRGDRPIHDLDQDDDPWLPVRQEPAGSGLPPVPQYSFGDGYDWMGELDNGWRPVAGWGRDGWDLGDWPYAIVAHFDGQDMYGLATYTEGDITVDEFPTREARNARTDEIAAFHWRLQGNGPADLPGSDVDLLPHHRGPYPPARTRREGGA